jgi:hypothetical protein
LSITTAVLHPKENSGSVFHRDLCTDYELQAGPFGSYVGPDRASEAISIGHGNSGVTERECLGNELIRMRGALKK